MQQTSVTDSNLIEFYQKLYPMQLDTQHELIDISGEKDPVIAIDCCGWHYHEIFQRDVIMLETIQSAKQFNFNRSQFTKLIDDRSSDNFVWPKIEITSSTVILDRSPLLKYKTFNQLSSMIQDIASKYDAHKIIARGSLFFVDDHRLTDRFYSWIDFHVPSMIIQQFFYCTTSASFAFILQNKK